MTVTTKADLLEQRAQLIAYAASKLKASTDWHALADVAMDLREVDAKLDLLAEMAESQNAAGRSQVSEWAAELADPVVAKRLG